MSEMYFGGMPVGPDVKRLNEKWPNLEIGDEIPYSQIEKAIGVSRRSNRFRSVTNAWRKELAEKGLITGCKEGNAFLILTHKQVVNGTYEVFSAVGRKIKRTRANLAAINPTDPEIQKNREHAARLCYMIEKDVTEKKKQIRAPNLISLPTPNLESNKSNSS